MDTSEVVRIFERVAQRWVDVVVPVYVDSDKSFVTGTGLGTMFVGSHRGTLYLFTAHHVIIDSMQHKFRVINLQGKAVDIGGLGFRGGKDIDIAFDELDKADLRGLVQPTISHVPIEEDWNEWTHTGIFSLLGYPATRNVLKPHFGSNDRHCFNLMATEAAVPSRRTKVPHAICLQYSPKAALDSDGARINPPDLHGMSGGPCFEIMFKHTSEGGTLRPRLRGVIVEHYASERLIVVSPLEDNVLLSGSSVATP